MSLVPTPTGGVIKAGRHYLPMRVYYEDTDFGGIVYHANYLKFAERGRTEFLRCLGVDQTAMKAEQGLVFAARRLTIDFQAPAVMDDQLLVESGVVSVTGARLVLEQQIGRILAAALELPSDSHASAKKPSDNQGAVITPLAHLSVTLACVDGQGRASRLPRLVADQFRDTIAE
ncbi:MAG: YbgC/FadM family acyl-CoA thioesterase [Pseudomonadota bacterium]